MNTQELNLTKKWLLPNAGDRDPNFVYAEDVFNFHRKTLLPIRDKKFSADFFQGNHVLEAATQDLQSLNPQGMALLIEFTDRVVRYPQIQIQTVEKDEYKKRRLSLEEIMKLHAQSADELVNNQLEIADLAGDNARLQTLNLLNESAIGLRSIQIASNMSITVAAANYTPHVLIPLFNITTATKLTDIAGLPLPEQLFQLEATSLNRSNPDLNERYF